MSNTAKTLTKGVALIPARDVTATNITIAVSDGTASGTSRNFQRLSSQCAVYPIHVCQASIPRPADMSPVNLAPPPTTYPLHQLVDPPRPVNVPTPLASAPTNFNHHPCTPTISFQYFSLT